MDASCTPHSLRWSLPNAQHALAGQDTNTYTGPVSKRAELRLNPATVLAKKCSFDV